MSFRFKTSDRLQMLASAESPDTKTRVGRKASAAATFLFLLFCVVAIPGFVEGMSRSWMVAYLAGAALFATGFSVVARRRIIAKMKSLSENLSTVPRQVVLTFENHGVHLQSAATGALLAGPVAVDETSSFVFLHSSDGEEIAIPRSGCDSAELDSFLAEVRRLQA